MEDGCGVCNGDGSSCGAAPTWMGPLCSECNQCCVPACTQDCAEMPTTCSEAVAMATGCASGCTGANEQCLAHELWDELSKHIHMFLSSVTLYDVVEGRIQGSALTAGNNAA